MAEGQEQPRRKELLDTYLEIFKQTTSLNLTAIAAVLVASQAFNWSWVAITLVAVGLGISLFMALVGMHTVLRKRETGEPLSYGNITSGLNVALYLSLGLFGGVVYLTVFIIALLK